MAAGSSCRLVTRTRSRSSSTARPSAPSALRRNRGNCFEVTRVTLGIAALLLAAPLRAENTPPTREQCFEAYESGQRSQKAAKLRAARQAYLLCADAVCP